VSPRVVPRRDHLSRQSPREGAAPAGSCRRIWLVGKQSKKSNRWILAPISFPTEWWPRLSLFHDAGSLPWLPSQGVYLGGLRRANQTRSGEVCLLRNRSNRTTCQCSSKFFGYHDLPIVAGLKGLTAESPKRYIPVRRGRSRRGGLSTSPNGPVAGLSPEIMENAV
jgi:hypothetical protein